MKNIFIGPSVRNGGSLINRLFDHHTDVGAYPMELLLPMDPILHPSLAERGQKKNIQNYPDLSSIKDKRELLRAALLNEEQTKCLIGSKFSSDRMNAKTTHMNVSSQFHHNRFIEELMDTIEVGSDVATVYNSIHRSFFNNWDDGVHSGSGSYVAYHSGNGLFADLDVFFGQFDGYFLQPIRSIRGILSSEKKKVSRQLIGRGVIGRRINISDRRLKNFYGQYVENLIVNWLIVFTRSVILSRRHGDRYIIYRHEDLVRDPNLIMRKLAKKIQLDFNESLISPTVAGIPWAGNSMFSKTRGLDENLAKTRDVFTKVEEEVIDKYCSGISDYLSKFDGKLVDLANTPDGILFDFQHQERFFGSRDATALYFASMYERWKYQPFASKLLNAFSKRPETIFL